MFNQKPMLRPFLHDQGSSKQPIVKLSMMKPESLPFKYINLVDMYAFFRILVPGSKKPFRLLGIAAVIVPFSGYESKLHFI